MSDPLRQVLPGEPIETLFSASRFNTMSDVTKRVQRQGIRKTGASSARDVNWDGEVLVRNDSGENRAQFDVLGIGGPLLDPGDGDGHERSFKRQVAIKGIAPTVGEVGRFVVLLQPIAAGRIGRAKITGVCPAIVDAPDGLKSHCDLVAGSYRLEMRSTGNAEVLWHDGSESGGLAIVHLGRREEFLIAGELMQDLHHAQTAEIALWNLDADGIWADIGRTEVVHGQLLQEGKYLPEGRLVVAARMTAVVDIYLAIAARGCAENVEES